MHITMDAKKGRRKVGLFHHAVNGDSSSSSPEHHQLKSTSKRARRYCSIEIPPEREGSCESESEDPRDFERPGGYCIINPGDRLKHGRYTALEKMGWGHFSTVWLCYDWIHKCVVGIKIQKSAKNYSESAKEEIVLLQEVRNRGGRRWPVVEILDHFEHFGRNGRHVCLVFEVLGKSLLSLIHRFDEKGLPLELVRRIAVNVMEGLLFLHENCRFIHTDIKPENVLILPLRKEFDMLNLDAQGYAQCLGMQKLLDTSSAATKNLTKNQKKRLKERRKRVLGSEMSDKYRTTCNGNTDGVSLTKVVHSDEAYARGEVKIIDMGNALYRDAHNSPEIQTRQYRCPEVILQAPYGASADIWSAACLFFELVTGEYLFEPRKCRQYAQDEDHLALMMECLGPIPQYVAERGHRCRDFFDRYGNLRNIKKLRCCPLESILIDEYHFSIADAGLLASFLSPMLRFDPDLRATARECLSHPFLTKARRGK